MKKIIIAMALTLAAGSAFAGATMAPKDTKSQGSWEGQHASALTGNGDAVGGNGTSGLDQTTGPHTRADALGAASGCQQACGQGKSNAGGNDNSHGH